MPYRELHARPEAAADFDQFLDDLRRALTDGRRDPNDVVRDTLYEIYYGAGPLSEKRERPPDPKTLSPTARAVLHNFDPRNVTTEPEY